MESESQLSQGNQVNAGIGMATGLANGSDGLTEGVLAGAGAYTGTKISNIALSSIISEIIQKAPGIVERVFDKNLEKGKEK